MCCVLYSAEMYLNATESRCKSVWTSQEASERGQRSEINSLLLHGVSSVRAGARDVGGVLATAVATS